MSIRIIALASAFGLCIMSVVSCVSIPSTDPDVHSFEVGQSVAQFVPRLRAAIAKNNMMILEGACGACGIRTLPHPDKDALIITVSHKGLMLEMLQSGAAMGAEPPLRFYISHTANGKTELRYHQPSAALAVYNAPGLATIGKELDQVFSHIAADAIR